MQDSLAHAHPADADALCKPKTPIPSIPAAVDTKTAAVLSIATADCVWRVTATAVQDPKKDPETSQVTCSHCCATRMCPTSQPPTESLICAANTATHCLAAAVPATRPAQTTMWPRTRCQQASSRCSRAPSSAHASAAQHHMATRSCEPQTAVNQHNRNQTAC